MRIARLDSGGKVWAVQVTQQFDRHAGFVRPARAQRTENKTGFYANLPTALAAKSGVVF
jgi:hypothetical protein